MTAMADHLDKGIAAARAGNKLLARLHLARATEAAPDHDLGWLWLAWVAESPKVAHRYLTRALDCNSDNPIALAGMNWLQVLDEWDFTQPLPRVVAPLPVVAPAPVAHPVVAMPAPAEQAFINPFAAPVEEPPSYAGLPAAPASFSGIGERVGEPFTVAPPAEPEPIVPEVAAPPPVSEGFFAGSQVVGEFTGEVDPTDASASLPVSQLPGWAKSVAEAEWRSEANDVVPEPSAVAEPAAMAGPAPETAQEMPTPVPASAAVDEDASNIFDTPVVTGGALGDSGFSLSFPDMAPPIPRVDAPTATFDNEPVGAAPMETLPATPDDSAAALMSPAAPPPPLAEVPTLAEAPPVVEAPLAPPIDKPITMSPPRIDKPITVSAPRLDHPSAAPPPAAHGWSKPATAPTPVESGWSKPPEPARAKTAPAEPTWPKQAPAAPTPMDTFETMEPSDPSVGVGAVPPVGGPRSPFFIADPSSAPEVALESDTRPGADAPDEDWQTMGKAEKRRVLIVDDSPTVCKIVSLTLEKAGFSVMSAGDGVEAMAMIAEVKPDLILLDITMPRMDGYQLCKLIKGYDSTRHIPVVMLSGKDGFFDRVRGRLVGCSDYLTKPFNPEVLVAAVERYMPAAVAQ